MGYVIAGILVLLIVAAGVTVFVLRAARTRQEAAIVAPDEGTPLGDTDQHAGTQTREGETASDPERGESRAPSGGGAAGGAGGVGGEAEGGRPVVPDSERLANRPR